MSTIDGSIFRIIKKHANADRTFLLLISYVFLYVLFNIYKSTIFGAVCFILITTTAIITFSKEKSVNLIFLLYPLARVLKAPGFETSLLTIILLVFYIKVGISIFINKENTSRGSLMILILYLIYVLFTISVSLINRNENFRFLSLASYYLYLALPLLIFAIIKEKSEIKIINSIILFSISFLFGSLITFYYYNFIPNGNDLLQKIGVEVFDVGASIIRYSPLTDDPNYGTVLILLLGGLFIISKKNRLQSMIGYPLIFLCFGLGLLSMSKMFILCLFVIFCSIIIKIMMEIDNLLVNFIAIMSITLLFISVLESNLGSALILRMIGSGGTFNLDIFTTGRSELFKEYSSYILSNPSVLLFGKGPLFADLSLFSHGDHNTYTKTIFGSGLIGVSIMFLIFMIMAKYRFDKQSTIPTNALFWGFILSLIICTMSLTLSPSTVFPLFVLAAQFVDFNKNEKETILEVQNEEYVV